MESFLGTKCWSLAFLPGDLQMPAPTYFSTSPAITRSVDWAICEHRTGLAYRQLKQARMIATIISNTLSHARRSPAAPGSDAAELSSEGFSEELAP